MNEAFAGLIIPRRAQEAGCRGAPVAVALRGAPTRFDLVAHQHPFLEPGIVVADTILQCASHAMHFVDLDPRPRRGPETDQEAHGPAIVGREIEEGRVVFAADHVSLRLFAENGYTPHQAALG